MYKNRLLSHTLEKATRQFPAVLISGPRQAGKTSFLRNTLGDRFSYISFDDPVERSFALSDPNGFLNRFNNQPVILDEIQYVPDLLTSIKLRMEEQENCNCRWLLTGSQQIHLLRRASETLAGRMALLELLPFSLLEQGSIPDMELDKLIWRGGFPELVLTPEKRELWLRSYMQTYVERHIRQLQNIRDLRAFENFVALACARHGREFNSARFSRETGITLPTARSWAALLEASYLAYFLPPYFDCMGKRVIKSPKLYMIDSAIACYLTRQSDSTSAMAGPMSAALFEGLIVSEAVKAFTNVGLKPALWYWRSHDGLEINLILQAGGQLIPIEVRQTNTPTTRHVESLRRFRALAGNDRCEPGLLVCLVAKEQPLAYGVTAMPWQCFPEWIAGRLA